MRLYSLLCVCLHLCFSLIVSAPGISILGALFLMKKVWKYQRNIVNLYTKLTIMAKAAKSTDSGVSKLQEALDKLNKAYGTEIGRAHV